MEVLAKPYLVLAYTVTTVQSQQSGYCLLRMGKIPWTLRLVLERVSSCNNIDQLEILVQTSCEIEWKNENYEYRLQKPSDKNPLKN